MFCCVGYFACYLGLTQCVLCLCVCGCVFFFFNIYLGSIAYVFCYFLVSADPTRRRCFKYNFCKSEFNICMLSV